MSADIVIPPSPNWYCGGALDCRLNSGLVSYAAARSLVFVWPTERRETGFPRVRVLPDAHRDKVTGVSWCRSTEGPLLLASCGEDGKVRVWNVDDFVLVLEHSVHQNQKVCCVTWSPADAGLVASAGEDGAVFLAQLTPDRVACQTRRVDCGLKQGPSSLALSPHTAHLMAVGCRTGLLLVVDTRKNRGVLHKLRAHEEDVQCLSWCPVRAGFDKTLLATSGRDRTVKVWAVEEGVNVAQARLPSNTGAHRPKTSQERDRRSVWVALHWLAEDQILTSGLGGELITWDAALRTWKVVHKQHARGLFNIAGYVGAPSQPPMVWTSAQDRNVVLWRLPEASAPAAATVLGVPELVSPWLCLATLGGFVYGLAVDPVDAAHLALGVGDGTVRLWNAAAAKPEMTMLWNGIKGKVTALAWHPTTEGRLAFGTNEGRVGVFDTLAPAKAPWLSRSYHKGTVYNLNWAPAPGRPAAEALYSCGAGRILIHADPPADKDAADFNKIVDVDGKGAAKFPARTELCWTDEGSLLAVGNDDGSVEVYAWERSERWRLLGVVVAHKKLIQSLQWHPRFTFASAEPSPLRHWLAVASNDSFVKVYAVTVAAEGAAEEPMTASLVATLTGHKERVVSLAWSPHQDGILLSASYDGTAQVWNVVDGKPVANFGGHGGRLMACTWNALEADTAVTGGEDSCLRVWNVSRQSHKTPAESLAGRRPAAPPASAGAKAAAAAVAGGASGAAAAPEPAKKMRSKLKSLFPVSAGLQARGRQHGLDDCKRLTALKGVALVNAAPPEGPAPLESDLGGPAWANLGFFGDSEAAVRMLQTETDYHVAGGNLDLAAQLQQWPGAATGSATGLEAVLRQAAYRQQLNDWLLALAPQVSLEFWREMSQCYGRQLASDGEPRKAVSYLMAAGLHADAVDALVGHHMHREAVALTRCLHPNGHQQVDQSLSLWASKATQDSNFELAAKCHLAADRVAEAARVVARRADAESLRLAADLAASCDLQQLASAYLVEAAEKTVAAAVESKTVPEDVVGADTALTVATTNGDAETSTPVVAAEPVEPDEPTASEPIEPDEPAASEPVEPDEPAASEPAASEPTDTEPAETESVRLAADPELVVHC